MKKQFTLFAAANLLFVMPAILAQTSGTSHPEAIDDSITITQPAKPSPAIPVASPQLLTRQQEVITSAPAAPVTTPAAVPSAFAARMAPNDDNAGVVIDVPSAANALPEGTLVRVKLGADISTRETEAGIQFSATTSQPIMKNGQVVIPSGAVLTGRITELASGRHLRRAAAIHLQPEFITLPDGTHYKLDGQVIDLASTNHAKVSHEGTILANDPAHGTAIAVGAATGVGALTGAVIGGGVGAVVGAGIGAGVSGAVWANQETSNTLHAGTEIVFALNQPMVLQNVTITN